MSNCKCSKCCNRKEFDAEEAYNRLNRKYTELADIVVQYMSEAKLKRPARAEKAFRMAEQLATVIGGSITTDFPECCFVQGSGAGFCSGVLVHPRIVLTAEHCGNVSFVGLNASSIFDSNAERCFAFPGQSPSNGDIQVVILQDDATTQPIQIARTTEINQASAVTFVGFGESNSGSGEKRKLNIQIKPNPGNVGFDPNTEFVTDGGACQGDSGGPAYVMVNGNRKVAGLHSRHTGNSCNDGGIYTRIDVHVDFIRDVAQSFGINF
jgi:endonuclease G